MLSHFVLRFSSLFLDESEIISSVQVALVAVWLRDPFFPSFFPFLFPFFLCLLGYVSCRLYIRLAFFIFQADLPGKKKLCLEYNALEKLVDLCLRLLIEA